jgi:hypothetical protein
MTSLDLSINHGEVLLSGGSTFKWVISTLWLGFVTEHGTLVFSSI